MNNVNASKGGYCPPSTARPVAPAAAADVAAGSPAANEVPAAVRHRLARPVDDAKATRICQREVAPAGPGPGGSAQASDGSLAQPDAKSAKAPKRPRETTIRISRGIFTAAVSDLPPGQARGAVAALAQTFGGAKASREVLDGLVAELADFLAAAPSSGAPVRGSDLVAGMLQGACGGEQEREAIVLGGLCRGLLDRHAAAYRASLDSGDELDADYLRVRLDVLTLGAGGPKISPARLRLLLDGVHAMQGSAREAEHEDPLQPEDLALAVGDICSSLGGRDIAPNLRAILLAHAADPDRDYDENQRGCMVYHLGDALGVWDGTPALRQEVLHAFADEPRLPKEALGYMAWGLGMHLLGVSPEAMAWHEEHTDLVCAGTAPVRRVVHAVMVQARSLQPSSAERLVAGLYAAADGLEGTPSMQAKLALRNAITRATPHCSPAQIAAMRAGYPRADAAAAARQQATEPQPDAAAAGRPG